MDGYGNYDPNDVQNILYNIREYDEIIDIRAVGRENIPPVVSFQYWVIDSTFKLLFGINLVDVFLECMR